MLVSASFCHACGSAFNQDRTNSIGSLRSVSMVSAASVMEYPICCLKKRPPFYVMTVLGEILKNMNPFSNERFYKMIRSKIAV
tara:strand:+ start:1150 stop:1398 length:249 start_codon:yes stop_codon:yes gene_type:complete